MRHVASLSWHTKRDLAKLRDFVETRLEARPRRWPSDGQARTCRKLSGVTPMCCLNRRLKCALLLNPNE